MLKLNLTPEQKEVFRQLGAAGGRKSRRTLSPPDLAMLAEARRKALAARKEQQEGGNV